jgi:hypothetical protein
MRRASIAVCLMAVLFSSSGCAVYMAAAGDEEPNISNVRRGASRGEIEMALGQPKSLVTDPNGQLAATYEYTVGNQPSTGRAIGHAVLDVLTLGGWELIGTPIEAFNQGDKVKVTVHYDDAGNATEIQSYKA